MVLLYLGLILMVAAVVLVAMRLTTQWNRRRRRVRRDALSISIQAGPTMAETENSTDR